jgi:hypothetical protein
MNCDVCEKCKYYGIVPKRHLHGAGLKGDVLPWCVLFWARVNGKRECIWKFRRSGYEL